MSRASPKIIGLQALTIVLFLMPFVGVGGYVWQKHLKAEGMLADMMPRHARLQGILAKQEDFTVVAKLAQGLIDAFVVPAAVEPTQLLNETQQKIKTAFTESGFNVEAIQVKEVNEADDYQRLKMTIRFEGTLLNLQQAMLKVRDITPALMVENLKITNQGPIKPAAIPRLSGSCDFVVLRAKK